VARPTLAVFPSSQFLQSHFDIDPFGQLIDQADAHSLLTIRGWESAEGSFTLATRPAFWRWMATWLLAEMKGRVGRWHWSLLIRLREALKYHPCKVYRVMYYSNRLGSVVDWLPSQRIAAISEEAISNAPFCLLLILGRE